MASTQDCLSGSDSTLNIRSTTEVSCVDDEGHGDDRGPDYEEDEDGINWVDDHDEEEYDDFWLERGGGWWSLYWWWS